MIVYFREKEIKREIPVSPHALLNVLYIHGSLRLFLVFIRLPSRRVCKQTLLSGLVPCCVRERERERERQSRRERQRERERERQRGRERERQRERDRQRETDRERARKRATERGEEEREIKGE